MSIFTHYLAILEKLRTNMVRPKNTKSLLLCIGCLEYDKSMERTVCRNKSDEACAWTRQP